jgi:CDP-glucose 4,6-dehydratase
LNNLFNHIYENKKVLITGHTGFKGSWLTYWLKQLGAKITGFSKDIPTDPSLFEVLMLEKEINHIVGDVRDHVTLLNTVQTIKPDYIFHLAAQPLVGNSYDNPSGTMTTNIIGVNNILDAVRVLGKKCTAVVITSDKCYDNLELERGYHENDILGGKDPYSASKGAAELVVKGYYHSFFKNQDLIRVATARAGNVIGGGDWAKDRIIPDCIRSWENEKKVKIRNPHSTRPWQHVLEPLSGYLLLGQQLSENNDFNGKSYNFGPPDQNDHTVLELIEQIVKQYDEDNKMAYEIIDQSSFHEAGLLKLDCTKAKQQLSWETNLNFEQTSYFTAKWYSDYKSVNVHNLTSKQIENYCETAIKKQLSWTK